MKAVVVERLVDGQPDTTETVHFHDVVVEIVEDVILRKVGRENLVPQEAKD